MVERYYLNKSGLPTIPTPHDCVVVNIRSDAGFLIFEFEDDISIHDSITYLHPTAQSLIIRFHLVEPDYELYVYERRKYEEGYIRRKNRKLFELPKRTRELEYLYHNVGYNSIIISMCSDDGVLLELQADYVELEWLERSRPI